MEIIAYTVTAALVPGLVWLNVLASFAVHQDPTLERPQKLAQTIIVWLIPYLGSAFVLHLIWQHSPRAIPEKWLPRPFRNLIYGRAIPPNRNRDEDSWMPLSGSHQRHRHDDSFGGND